MNNLFRNKYLIPSTRLVGYDYGQPGFYFVTICTELRAHYFGRVVDGEMVLSAIGQTAMDCWSKIPKHFPHVMLDEFVMMPNHVHGIIIINRNADVVGGGVGGGVGVETLHATSLHEYEPHEYEYERECEHEPPKCITAVDFMSKISPKHGTLSTIIRSYKSACTKQINQHHNRRYFAWQTRFYDHIIRNETAYFNIRKYIINNPAMWHRDRNNPDGLLM